LKQKYDIQWLAETYANNFILQLKLALHTMQKEGNIVEGVKFICIMRADFARVVEWL
jgi:hypothetical protein